MRKTVQEVALPDPNAPDVPQQKQFKSKVIEAQKDSYGRRAWTVEKELQNEEDEYDDGYFGGQQTAQSQSVHLNFKDSRGNGFAKIVPARTVNLKRRTEDLGIDKMVGKKQIVQKDAKESQVAVYYCELCKCSVKDSMTWLDHINGKSHNRLLGMNMRVERVGVDRVKSHLQQLALQKKVQQIKAIKKDQKIKEKIQLKNAVGQQAVAQDQQENDEKSAHQDDENIAHQDDEKILNQDEEDNLEQSV